MTAPGTASVFADFRFPREVISVAVRWYLPHGLSYRDAGELLAERGVAVDHVSVYRWVQRLAAARRFFARAVRAGTVPVEVTTDRAPVYPPVPGELVSSALHIVEQYANNPIEADHGRLNARLRPMRGVKRHRSARTIAAGHAFVQNLRR